MTISFESRTVLRQWAEAETSECETLDFEELFAADRPYDWVSIVKDIVAMANTSGGAIVFGCDTLGRLSPSYIDNVSAIDPATIVDKVFSYTGEQMGDILCEQVQRHDEKRPAWLVGKWSRIIVFKENGFDDPIHPSMDKCQFRQGQVYFRHGSKSEAATSSDIEAKVLELARSMFVPPQPAPVNAGSASTALTTVLPAPQTPPPVPGVPPPDSAQTGNV
jgi:predicted HTH transcriptional regulator